MKMKVEMKDIDMVVPVDMTLSAAYRLVGGTLPVSDGYVYFLKIGNDILKVGSTKDVANRMYQLSKLLKEEFILMRVIPTSRHRTLERTIHYYLKHSRFIKVDSRGTEYYKFDEWFFPEVVYFIDSFIKSSDYIRCLRRIHIILSDAEAEAIEDVKGRKTTWKDVLIRGGIALREEGEHVP